MLDAMVQMKELEILDRIEQKEWNSGHLVQAVNNSLFINILAAIESLPYNLQFIVKHLWFVNYEF